MPNQIVTGLKSYLTDYFTGSSCYYERVVGSNDLLICLGDSWTWGDSLGRTQAANAIDDAEYRLSHIYGHLMAQSLNSDFVNLARPGSSNFDIFENLNLVLAEVASKYQQIYLVVTLTENCREFAHSNNTWPIRADFNKDSSSLNALLEAYEARMFEQFKNSIKKYPNVKALVGRNFTFSYNTNNSILEGMQPNKTWVEILSEHQQLPGYPGDLRILSQMAYQPLESYLRHPDVKLFKKFKLEMFEMFSGMSDAIEWLDESALNCKNHTRHPTELAHCLWADYLLTYFK